MTSVVSFLSKFRWLLLIVGIIVATAIISISHQKAVDQKIINAKDQQLAQLGETVKVQNGLYERSTQQSSDIKDLLGKKDKQLSDLQDQLKKTGSKAISGTDLELKLIAPQTLSGKAKVETIIGEESQETDSPVPTPNVQVSPKNYRVVFETDSGLFHIAGYTDTIPGTYKLTMSQPRPLKVSMVVAQDKSGQWKTIVSTDPDNYKVDVKVSGIDTDFFAEKWYQKIGINLSLASDSSLNILGGLGFSYKFDKFELGPSVWMYVNDHVDRLYGLNMIWHPFAK